MTLIKLVCSLKKPWNLLAGKPRLRAMSSRNVWHNLFTSLAYSSHVFLLSNQSNLIVKAVKECYTTGFILLPELWRILRPLIMPLGYFLLIRICGSRNLNQIFLNEIKELLPIPDVLGMLRVVIP